MDHKKAEAEFIAAFQARLKRAREERGMTQEALAMSLDLPKSTYKKYETRPGSSFPPYLLARLSTILDRPLGYWIYGHEAPKALQGYKASTTVGLACIRALLRRRPSGK
jgi:transcriptional regulator with XRE-family HTH domain